MQGIVTRDKMTKTRRVEIQRLVQHPKYGKYIKRRTVCYVHDEKNESHLGDTVEIMESPAAVEDQALAAGAGRDEGPEPHAVEPGRGGRRQRRRGAAPSRRGEAK